MRIVRQIVVFDAADLTAESTFWAGLLGGTVVADKDWRSVVVDGEWRLASSLLRTMSHPSGPTERRSRSTSTSTSTTSTPPMM